jgi:hypothetical protein
MSEDGGLRWGGGVAVGAGSVKEDAASGDSHFDRERLQRRRIVIARCHRPAADPPWMKLSSRGVKRRGDLVAGKLRRRDCGGCRVSADSACEFSLILPGTYQELGGPWHERHRVERIPAYNRVSIRAALVHGDEDAGPALRAAGITNDRHSGGAG